MPELSATNARSATRRVALVGGFLVVLLALVAFNVLRNRSPRGADPENAAQVALGRQVYAANCASCHGANLEGQPNWQQDLPTGGRPAPPHDASGHTWHHNDQSLFTTTKYGGQATAPAGYKSNMPAFGNVLSDQQIWAVLAYIKSTWSPDIRAAQQRGHQ